MPYQTAAATHDIQAHQVFAIFVPAQGGKDVCRILRGNGADTVQIRLADVCCAGAQDLFHDGFLHLDTEAVQQGVLECNHALVDAELFRPAFAFHRLFVRDIQEVHGAVADVGQKISAGEVSQTGDDGYTCKDWFPD